MKEFFFNTMYAISYLMIENSSSYFAFYVIAPIPIYLFLIITYRFKIPFRSRKSIAFLIPALSMSILLMAFVALTAIGLGAWGKP